MAAERGVKSVCVGGGRPSRHSSIFGATAAHKMKHLQWFHRPKCFVFAKENLLASFVPSFGVKRVFGCRIGGVGMECSGRAEQH